MPLNNQLFPSYYSYEIQIHRQDEYHSSVLPSVDRTVLFPHYYIHVNISNELFYKNSNFYIDNNECKLTIFIKNQSINPNLDIMD